MKTENLLNTYYDWVKENYSVKKLEKIDEIITPFVDPINDNISIYLDRLENSKIQLSDDGYTLNNLEMIGINLTNSRKQILNEVLDQFSIKLSADNTLFVVGFEKEFPIMKYRMTSAILKINDLLYTKKDNVKNIFMDDVINYFQDNDFGGISTSITGQSGIKYNFKYAIPNKGENPLRLVNIQNNISPDQVMINAFQFGDIKNNSVATNLKIKYIIVFNDAEKTLSKKSRKIAETYDLNLIPWSNKQLIDQIKD